MSEYIETKTWNVKAVKRSRSDTDSSGDFEDEWLDETWYTYSTNTDSYHPLNKNSRRLLDEDNYDTPEPSHESEDHSIENSPGYSHDDDVFSIKKSPGSLHNGNVFSIKNSPESSHDDVFSIKNSPRSSHNDDVFSIKNSSGSSHNDDVFSIKNSSGSSHNYDVFSIKKSPGSSHNDDVFSIKKSPGSSHNDVFSIKNSPGSHKDDVYSIESSPEYSHNDDVYSIESSPRSNEFDMILENTDQKNIFIKKEKLDNRFNGENAFPNTDNVSTKNWIKTIKQKNYDNQTVVTPGTSWDISTGGNILLNRENKTVYPTNNRTYVISVLIPHSEAESITEALILLGAQNVGLNTEQWAVVNDKCNRPTESGEIVAFAIDRQSFAALRAHNFTASMGFNKLNFRVKKYV